jgi:hypothetical protein
LARIYHLSASERPAKLRLLVLMAPGDLAANTPIDCLLEHSDIDLDLYYVSEDGLFASPIPAHDVLMVGLSEADENQALLAALSPALAGWPKPIINLPDNIPSVGREAASLMLQNVPGLFLPKTEAVDRATLQALATGMGDLGEVFPEICFPVILRPVGSHAGRDLERIDNAELIADYLSRIPGNDFFISRFIDYRGQDGLYRKFRVALIAGRPFACHMAISSHWMVHYVNAGMYEEEAKRAEEARFMANFADFSLRHRVALDAIFRRTGLHYVCIDCAETLDGDLLVFEIDHAMVVHAMDPEDLFPYKQPHMEKVRQAFREFALGLVAGHEAKAAA